MTKVQMPEPVAYLYEPDNELFSPYDLPAGKIAIVEGLITTEQAEAYAKARVDEVLDMVADKASQKYLIPEFAKAIRRLKEKS